MRLAAPVCRKIRDRHDFDDLQSIIVVILAEVSCIATVPNEAELIDQTELSMEPAVSNRVNGRNAEVSTCPSETLRLLWKKQPETGMSSETVT
jgi:hypothetical protein